MLIARNAGRVAATYGLILGSTYAWFESKVYAAGAAADTVYFRNSVRSPVVGTLTFEAEETIRSQDESSRS